MKRDLFLPSLSQTLITAFIISVMMLPALNGWGQGLPAMPKILVEKAIDNWNKVYGTNVRATGWTYEGKIRTEKERQSAISEITNPTKAWMPQVNLDRPSAASADRVSSFPAIPASDIRSWKDSVSSKIKSGQHKVRVKWMKGTTTFTTLCITDDKTIIYDNMFSNTALQDHHSRCYDSHLCWIWQSSYADCSRGAIWADLTVKCDPDGTPHCTNDCGGWMSGGTANCKCVVTKVGNCCHMEYTWAWACGFKKVKFKLDAKGVKFEAEIEGYLGSEGSGDGSCEECCPKPTNVSMNPVITPHTTGSAGIVGPQNVSTVSVSTLSGEVVDVKVPNNIRPGDNITGSISTRGQSAKLEGAVIDVQDHKSNVKDRLFSFIVPAGLATIPFMIRNDKGETIGMTQIPVNTPNVPQPGNNISVPANQIEIPAAHSPGNFAPMNYCQPGQPLTINGFFDGNASNTSVSINNVPCEIIAESPRGSFVQVPDNLHAGQATINISEGNATASMHIQVVTTNLSANKTVVQRGTNAKVTATVSGLENLDLNNNNFKLEMTNNSPAVVQFRGANSTTITKDINSGNVKNGIFTFTTDITGVSTGSYSIGSNVSSTTCTNCWQKYKDCIDKCEQAEKKCYEDCDKNNGGLGCYLACSATARACEAACFAEYLNCVRQKLGY